MNSLYIFMALLLSILLMTSKSYGQDELPVLEGPYLGQEPPGSMPKVFAPGIVTTPDWGDAGRFSPDMNEFYVSRWRVVNNEGQRESVTFKKVNNRWQKIVDPLRTRLPSFSPDGNTMYFGKSFKARTKDGWTPMQSISPAFDEIGIMGLSASKKGTLVIDERGNNGNGILRYSRLIDGKREAPQPFGKQINTGTWNAHPFIAPDESFIMWDGERESGFGSNDLYISFRLKDGTWGEAINLGETVNTAAEEGGPHITPDGKYLLFNRVITPEDGQGVRRSDLYWVDAKFIDDLRPKNALTTRIHSDFAPRATAAEAELPFREIPYLETAYINESPAKMTDNIPVGILGIDGGNKEVILELAKEIADGKLGKFDSVLIAQKGKLLFESYYSRGRVNLPHFQASATKAYTSFAIGRAIQLGYLTMADLDKPIIDFLKDLDSSKLVKGADRITLSHAMTMRSGIEVTREQRDEFEKDPSKLKGQAHAQAFLENSAPITADSQIFKYKFDPILVMQVLEAVVPGSAKDFIKKELLDKLGITTYGWRTDLSGLPTSGSRASMTSRAMMKWGTLAMNNGKWQGEQLIPEVFVAKATSRIFLTGDDDFHYGGKNTVNQGYGYYWWSADLKHGDRSYFSKSAQGGWGQFIVLIEELDLIVVFTAHDNDTNYLQILAERILPAFVP